MKVSINLTVLAFALAAAAAHGVESATPTSALQQRLNTIEKMKVTEQKLPAGHAAPVSTAVKKALADAAAAERDRAPTAR